MELGVDDQHFRQLKITYMSSTSTVEKEAHRLPGDQVELSHNEAKRHEIAFVIKSNKVA
jgi:hypothetical protein